MKLCSVFACNKKYFTKFTYSCKQLILNGNYKGDICLIISDDLVGDKLLDSSIIRDNNIIIKHFEKIKINQKKYNNAIAKDKVDGCSLKFNLFKTYFKRWDFIFYMDCGIHILDDITAIINEATENKLLAHSDSYPTYKWKLKNQFNANDELNKKYNLDIDYFQSTVMLFDTSIIEDKTFTEIIELVNKYPVGRTNDQCYLSIYFIIIKPCWKQIRINNEQRYFYDYVPRNKEKKYIMLKSLQY